jgi:ribosomal protein S10
MKYYQITITSKNKQSLKDYSKFFNNNIEIFKLLSKSYNKIKNKKIITILKSPHVNKKAQEQFEFSLFSKQITLQMPNSYKFLILLKKIETNLFSDVNIKIKLLVNKNLPEKFQTKIFNPSYFQLNFFKTDILFDNNAKKMKFKKKNLLDFKKATQIFKIFDIYGEIFHKNLT